MYDGGISIETYSAGAVRDASMVDNEQLKCTATLPLYRYNLGKCGLTDEFFRAFATLIYEKKNQIFGFPCSSTLEDLSIDVSITNV